MIRRRPAPSPPPDGPPLALPKPRREDRQGQVDTSPLRHRKVHPERDPAYRAWLTLQRCVIGGKTNNRTGVVHVCWSPEVIFERQYRSDPMHLEKAWSGRLKHSDYETTPGCRHAHREGEGRTAQFDADYGIDSVALAREFYERYKKERGIE